MDTKRGAPLRAVLRSQLTLRPTTVLFGLALALAIVVLFNDYGFLTPDTKPELYLRPFDTLVRFASSWLDTPNLGAPNYNVGYVPIATVFALLDAVGIPGWLIMRIGRYGLLLLAAFGARVVLREILGSRVDPRLAGVGSVAVAVAYAANPYLLVGGGTLPTMLPYALLPWLVVCWLRGSRSGSWRWAAAAALVLAGMSGINAGIVPVMQLVVVVPVVLHSCVVEGHRLRDVAWLVGRTGLIYVLLSAYWLVPALTALASATAVAGATESVAAINTANSFPEVLRGLGMWTLYGADGQGWFDPQHIALAISPLVVLLSFGGPLLAAIGVRLSDSPGRIFGSVSVLTGALVMVGSHPVDAQTPWGRGMLTVMESVPGLIAFRTTNKAGAVLELGMAVLMGLAATAIALRLRETWQQVVATGAGALVVAGSVFPVFTGGLYWIPMDMPSYWRDAADVVNARGADSRVLMVPGTGQPSYSWGYSGPDEIGPSLFQRPFVFRSAWPSGGEYSSNLLAGVDARLHQGTLPDGSVSALASYVGAGDVVGRYDVSGPGNLGARVERILDNDSGLGAVSRFGPAGVAHGAAAPATVRQVAGSAPATSANVHPADGALIIDGAGGGLPNLQAAGLLDDRPALLLAGGLTDRQLADAVGDGGRVVLTDSNARRTASNQNPSLSGPLLRASQDPGSTRALFDTPDQTVAEVRGNASVTATGRGLLFGPHPTGDVHQAFDGDRTTSWRFGNFGTGTGNAVHITMDRSVEASAIQLAPMQGRESRITSATVTATVGGATVRRDVTFTEWATFPTRVELGAGGVSAISIEVTGVVGPGIGPVGFSEISVPGLHARTVGVLPQGVTSRLRVAAATAGVDLVKVPVDVIMRRSAGDIDGLSSEEPRLERSFTLPDRRELTASGTVSLAVGAADSDIDRLAGMHGDVTAESSSRRLGSPESRASKAFDSVGGQVDQSTAWVPAEPVVGEWITVAFPQRRLESFTVSQAGVGARATRALVSVNDGEPFEADLGTGTSRVVLPEPTDASRVRILITGREGSGSVRFTDIGLPRVAPSSVQANECVPIGTIDGRELLADLGTGMPRLLDGEAVPFTGCEERVELGAGRHDVGSVSAWAVDDLHLSSGIDAAPVTPAPSFEVVSHGTSTMSLRVTDDCSPCVISSGQAHDARWQAFVGDKSLGAPLVVDGFAAGWRATLSEGETVDIRYGPTRTSIVAWLVSGGAFLLCLGLLAAGGWTIPRVRRRNDTDSGAAL